MNTKIIITFDIGGVLTDLQAITLSDDDSVYGIRSRKTGKVLVAAGTALTRTATGTYEFDYSTILGFKASDGYDFAVTYTRTDGKTFCVPGEIPAVGDRPEEQVPAALASYRMSLSALIGLTRMLLSDPGGERYSQPRILEELNNAMVEAAVDSRCIHDQVDMQIREDVFEYDPKGQAFNDLRREVMLVERVEYNDGDSPSLLKTTTLGVDLYFGGVQDGDPFAWTDDQVDPGKISIYMIPTADGATLPDLEDNIRVFYAALPTYLSDVAAYPDAHLPPQYHSALAYGAARNLLLEERDLGLVEKGMDYDGVFNVAVGKMRAGTVQPSGALSGMIPL